MGINNNNNNNKSSTFGHLMNFPRPPHRTVAGTISFGLFVVQSSDGLRINQTCDKLWSIYHIKRTVWILNLCVEVETWKCDKNENYGFDVKRAPAIDTSRSNINYNLFLEILTNQDDVDQPIVSGSEMKLWNTIRPMCVPHRRLNA